jgi:hypothetical protein
VGAPQRQRLCTPTALPLFLITLVTYARKHLGRLLLQTGGYSRKDTMETGNWKVGDAYLLKKSVCKLLGNAKAYPACHYHCR